MSVPTQPKIYHILHVDRLPSVLADGWLWCDAEIRSRASVGTAIGMSTIKERRLTKSKLNSHPDLDIYVGQCVPFYFCPRSIMLYVISRRNHPELAYAGGQEAIIHLEADLNKSVAWANQNTLRWAFTLSNAGSAYFEDRCNLTNLHEINWDAVNAVHWKNCSEEKQAEFLLQRCFPWQLVERIGVHDLKVEQQVTEYLGQTSVHRPVISVKREWYY